MEIAGADIRHAPCTTHRVTAPRIIVSGATVAVTRRTTLRKAFLGPWEPRVAQCWLYALADAQRHTGVAVNHFVSVVTHHHVSVTLEQPNLPEFSRRFHADVSCSLNTLLAEQRYDAPRELFDGRQAHYMRLLDAPAQSTQLVYERLNCVAAGLVSRPEHMPGDCFDFELWKTGHIEVERPALYFDRSRPDVIRMPLSPPPLLLHAFGGDIERLVYQMKRLCEYGGQQLRAARARPPMGARAVQRLHPWSEPRTLRERGRQRIPTFRIGARGIDGRAVASAAAEETHEFRKEHRQVRLACRDGGTDVKYPFGTYGARVYQGAAVEPEPKATAIVTRPGPLPSELCPTRADVADDAEGPPDMERSLELLDMAREAFNEEAPLLVEQADLVFEQSHGGTASTAAASGEAEEVSTPVVVRHRFDSRTDSSHRRRVITLRDRRRGRPASASRHGADPPG